MPNATCISFPFQFSQFRLLFRLPFVILFCISTFSVVSIPSHTIHSPPLCRCTYKLKAFPFHFHSFIAFKCFCIEEHRRRHHCYPRHPHINCIHGVANGYGDNIISLRISVHCVPPTTATSFTFFHICISHILLVLLSFSFCCVSFNVVGRHRSAFIAFASKGLVH